MKARVYNGPGRSSWEEVPRPDLQQASDAVVRVD
jgi:alcohol dehydrogenase